MAFTANDFGLWAPALAPVVHQSWLIALQDRVEGAYNSCEQRVFPPRKHLFSALQHTPPRAVRCIIIGQDPYHGENQAHGMSFSVEKGVAIPPSLRNIYKELYTDLGITPASHGCLEFWAKQGVLLLNNVLTVYEGQANSHQKWGWSQFTSEIINIVEQQQQPIAYILWGRYAQKKGEDCNIGRNGFPRLIIKSNHPSPLSASRGFFGSRPFSQVNTFLRENGVEEICWQLPE